MKKLLIAATLLAASGPAFAQDVVRLGTEGAYPPYNFINDAGEVAGFEDRAGRAAVAGAIEQLRCVVALSGVL